MAGPVDSPRTCTPSPAIMGTSTTGLTGCRPDSAVVAGVAAAASMESTAIPVEAQGAVGSVAVAAAGDVVMTQPSAGPAASVPATANSNCSQGRMFLSLLQLLRSAVLAAVSAARSS